MSNTTTIIGNLTREPETRNARDGQATAQLGVAVNRRWQDKTTLEWQESTSFFDVICWRDLAENFALSLKGMRVVVTGRMEQRSWETDDGEHRSNRSRSWPTRSARPCASPRPKSIGSSAAAPRRPPSPARPKAPRSALDLSSRATGHVPVARLGTSGNSERPNGPTRRRAFSASRMDSRVESMLTERQDVSIVSSGS